MYYQIYRDSQSAWRWRLRAANHRVVADSGEGYYNKMDCLHAINLVKGTMGAPVYEA